MLWQVFLLLECISFVLPSPDTTTNWCNYLKSSAEPKILVYNRIPKCGSSTVLEILSNMTNIRLENLHEEYWGDYTANATRMHDLRERLATKADEKIEVIVGHVSYRTISKALGYTTNKSIEYMQIFRECESRFHSHWIYNFNYSVHAMRARLEGHLYEWHQQCTGTELPYSCIVSPKCMARAPLTTAIRTNMIEYYMQEDSPTSAKPGGERKIKSGARSQRIQKQANFIPNRNSYVTFGLTEYMAQYLEMLECAYPSIFAGVPNLYAQRNGIKANEHSTDPLPTTVDVALRGAAHSACSNNATLSSDGVLYASFLSPVFWSRYRAMKASPERCCRRKLIA